MSIYSASAKGRSSGPSHSGRQTGYAPNTMASAAAAHDLANYLQVISSAIRIIERSLSCDAKNTLSPIVQGAHASLDHAFCLSRRVAETAARPRSEVRRVSIAKRMASLEPVIALAVGPAVRVEFSLDETPDVVCDPDALDNAIMNLVVNATRAMAGDGRLSIALTREVGLPNELPLAVVRVADSGCGMSPDVTAAAFRPGVTTKPDGRGAGLGLATVSEFARSSGGDASIESQLGRGTVVTISLPTILKSVKRSRCA